jgi:hypothetical protein
MTEAEIKDRVTALANAIADDDEAAAKCAALALLGSVLVDLNRIANAIEMIASPRGAPAD